MKYKKLILGLVVFLSVFVIYLGTNDKKINYIALGDSLAKGQNPYGEINYGYADYIANYLERNDLLKFYTKDFAESGDKISDLLEKMKDNQTVQVGDQIINIKSTLRESDLVTISIGANDFIKSFQLESLVQDLSDENLLKKVDEILPQLDEVLKEVRKYAKNEIIVVGYYNPLPRATKLVEEKIDQLFSYADQAYQNICQKYNITYLSMYDTFKNHDDYLPNPMDIHPNIKGYEAMANIVIDHLEKNILN